jgi:hypothetical protein
MWTTCDYSKHTELKMSGRRLATAWSNNIVVNIVSSPRCKSREPIGSSGFTINANLGPSSDTNLCLRRLPSLLPPETSSINSRSIEEAPIHWNLACRPLSKSARLLMLFCCCALSSSIAHNASYMKYGREASPDDLNPSPDTLQRISRLLIQLLSPPQRLRVNLTTG